jgi:MFS family permease
VYAAGFVSEHMTVRETFLAAAALTLLVAVFGLWKPPAVFNHTYDLPQARASGLLDDLKRLLRHRAIYPAVLINFLWYFTPGIGTPMQFYMTNHLHTSDALFADYMSLYTVSFVPTILLYGFLCTRIRQRTLLWCSALIGVPQMLPLLFAHTGQSALLMAVPMGMMGGMANAAFYDLAIRSCPSGLQGTFMMLIVALMALAFRGSDLLGSWIYASSPAHGFQYCVIAIVSVYALILPIIALVPKHVTATTDGQASAPA